MTKPKITPGDWQVKETYQGALTDRFKGFPFTVNGDGFQPCLIFGDGTENRGVAAANAHAIAALPKCLEALERIAMLNGNLPPSTLDGKCGPNDGAQRGIKLRAAIELAQSALLEAGYTD